MAFGKTKGGYGLFDIEDPAQATTNMYGNASRTAGSMMQAQPEPPGPTAGGGIMAGAGGALMGAQLAGTSFFSGAGAGAGFAAMAGGMAMPLAGAAIGALSYCLG